jgi:hypothetical protein
LISDCFENGVQAEAAASAGERAVRGFMVAVYRATSNVASIQQVRSHRSCMEIKTSRFIFKAVCLHVLIYNCRPFKLVVLLAVSGEQHLAIVTSLRWSLCGML